MIITEKQYQQTTNSGLIKTMIKCKLSYATTKTTEKPLTKS